MKKTIISWLLALSLGLSSAVGAYTVFPDTDADEDGIQATVFDEDQAAEFTSDMSTAGAFVGLVGVAFIAMSLLPRLTSKARMS